MILNNYFNLKQFIEIEKIIYRSSYINFNAIYINIMSSTFIPIVISFFSYKLFT
jgi:hypothetical protein